MTDAEAEELEDALEFFVVEVPSGRNFELLHALLAHFLRVHGAAIQSRESLRMRADRVRDAARKTWEGLDALMQEVRCALGFFGGQHGHEETRARTSPVAAPGRIDGTLSRCEGRRARLEQIRDPIVDATRARARPRVKTTNQLQQKLCRRAPAVHRLWLYRRIKSARAGHGASHSDAPDARRAPPSRRTHRPCEHAAHRRCRHHHGDRQGGLRPDRRRARYRHRARYVPLGARSHPSRAVFPRGIPQPAVSVDRVVHVNDTTSNRIVVDAPMLTTLRSLPLSQLRERWSRP